MEHDGIARTEDSIILDFCFPLYQSTRNVQEELLDTCIVHVSHHIDEDKSQSAPSSSLALTSETTIPDSEIRLSTNSRSLSSPLSFSRSFSASSQLFRPSSVPLRLLPPPIPLPLPDPIPNPPRLNDNFELDLVISVEGGGKSIDC